jgi:subtilase family serine protease
MGRRRDDRPVVARMRRYAELRLSLAMTGAAAVALTALVGGCSLSGSGGSSTARPVHPVLAAAAEQGCRQRTASVCFSPQQLQVAYGVAPLLGRGIDGRGQTIVLQEFAKSLSNPEPPGEVPITDIRQDLTLFDKTYGLPTAQLSVDPSLVGSASPWLASGEEVEDAEIVHTIAPGAAIRVILIPRQSSPGGAVAATDSVIHLAASQGSVVVIAGQTNEQCYTAPEVAGLTAALRTAQARHLTVVAPSGDVGAAIVSCPDVTPETAVKGVGLYAAEPLVLVAGGTSLDVNPTSGAYAGETAWNAPVPQPVATTGPVAGPVPVVSASQVQSAQTATASAGPPGTSSSSPTASSSGIPDASGGGFSRLFRRPAYQNGIPAIGAHRGVPDVAADADPRTGMTLAAATNNGQASVFYSAGGTSAAGPLWAGLIALADQDAGRALGFVNPAIYRIARGTNYRRAFHDITTGNNTMRFPDRTITGYHASPGWDAVTGWGSPNADVLIPLLARRAKP